MNEFLCFKLLPFPIILEVMGCGGAGRLEDNRRKYCGQGRMGNYPEFVSEDEIHSFLMLGCVILFSLPEHLLFHVSVILRDRQERDVKAFEDNRQQEEKQTFPTT